MNKKITRRVVLGTTVAALVAGPFVMRSMRKSDIPIVLGGYEEAWQKSLDRTKVSIDPSRTLKGNYAGLRLPSGKRFSVFSVDGWYDFSEQCFELSHFPGPPSLYWTMSAVVSAYASVFNGSPLLSVDADEYRMTTRNIEHAVPAGTGIIGCSAEDEEDLFAVKQDSEGELAKISRWEASPQCMVVARRLLTPRIPFKGVVPLDSEWTAPAGPEAFTHRVTGYAKVNGHSCLVISSKRELEGQRYVDVITKMWKDNEASMKEANKPFDHKRAKESIAMARKDNTSEIITTETYVDAETGIAIHQKSVSDSFKGGKVMNRNYAFLTRNELDV